MVKRKLSDPSKDEPEALPSHKACRHKQSDGASKSKPRAKPTEVEAIRAAAIKQRPSQFSENNPLTLKDENATTRTYLKVVETTDDIFAAPPSSVLIHACNCEGHWGAGIAKAFRDRYPRAYQIYRAHCAKSRPADLPGTAFLIPPQTDGADAAEASAGHFVACLFTSRGKGRTKDSPTKILANTGPAMRDLLRQIKAWNGKQDGSVKTGELSMCKINSGLFKVPWEKTRAVLEEIEVENDTIVTVVEKG